MTQDPGFTLAELVEDWERHLRAKNRSRGTITSYRIVAHSFSGYLAERGMRTEVTGISREHIESYLADRLAAGRSPADTAKHFRWLQQLFKWLEAEGEIPANPMARMSRSVGARPAGAGVHRRAAAGPPASV